MQWLVLSKNNLFFVFLVFGYVFGVMLYDFIGFKFTDELMALFAGLFVVILCIERNHIKGIKPLLITSGIFAFYVIYSFLIQSNTASAILQDAIVQYKPYLTFFSILLLRPRLSKTQKLFIVLMCILGSMLLLVVAAMSWYSEFFGHASRFATAATVTAFLFFYCSSFDKKDIFLFCLLLGISLFSTRSKSYGFVFFVLFYIALVKSGYKIRFNLTSIVLITLLAGGVLWVSWDKIAYYFITGANTAEMYARPVLYYVAWLILMDYFPFGSGFASFASYFSGVSYSKTYSEYGIDQYWGLSKEMPDFIADTFYPSLAQYGVVGVVLFFYFWIWVYRSMPKNSVKLHAYSVMLIVFFTIESVADSTFTHNRGLFLLILLALALQGKEGDPTKSIASS